MHKQYLFFLLLFVRVEAGAQEKIKGLGLLELNKTNIAETKDLIYVQDIHYYGADYGIDETGGDSNLVELKGKYGVLGIEVNLCFFHDTLYKIDIESYLTDYDFDELKQEKQSGDFYAAFVMQYGGGKVSVKSGNILCKCLYCTKPSKYFNYDSVRTWSNGNISAKMHKKYTTVYADGGCNDVWEKSLEIENLETTERTKNYLKRKATREKAIKDAKTKELSKKL